MNIDIKGCANKSLKARELSYSPYSHFRVGAALVCQDGSVYLGANIENAAYSPTNCAERTAFFRAIMDGKRDFCAIFISGVAVRLMNPMIFARRVACVGRLCASFVTPTSLTSFW